MRLSIAMHAKLVLEILKKHGFEAYVVGGAVRDLLRGMVPADYDIATNALPDQVKSLFTKCIATGEKHGTVTVILCDHPIEVTTYRIDGAYHDARHPDSVRFASTIKDDLSRRDFTINAMAYNGDTLLDVFGGLADLRKKCIRTVGDPGTRFSEDALRILRAFRFASVFCYEIERKTLTACIEKAPLLQRISRERIYTELTKTLCGEQPQMLQPLLDCGGLRFLQVQQCNLSLLEPLPKSAEVRYAAFCRLSNCPPQQLLQALHAPKRQTEQIRVLYSLFSEKLLPDNALLKKQLQFIPKEKWIEAIYAYGLLFGQDMTEISSLLQDIIKNKEPFLIEMLAVNGEDLKALGMRGKAIGNMLLQLLDRTITKPDLNQKDTLIKLAKSLIDS